MGTILPVHAAEMHGIEALFRGKCREEARSKADLRTGQMIKKHSRVENFFS